MLYISRRVGEVRFGIVDTDDMTEEVVDRRILNDIVRLGIPVAGVSTYERVDRNGTTRTCISDITVYQNMDYATTRQAKAKVLQGVDIRTSGTEITFVGWDEKTVKPGTIVRLSDYGTKCGDSIFEAVPHSDEGRLTVIIDDKIRVRSKTFYASSRSGIVFDIREVNRERVIKWIYHEWMTRGVSIDSNKFIIDEPERKACYSALTVVETGYNRFAYQHSDSAVSFVESYFIDEFKKLVASDFKYISSMESKQYAKDHIKSLKKNVYLWRSMSHDYEKVRNEDGLDVFVALSKCTTCNTNWVIHFSNFMYHFTPSDKVKELYVTLCNRANNWFLDLGKSKRWII